MRIMGIDRTLRSGDNPNILSVNIIEEVDGVNEIICTNTLGLNCSDESLAEVITTVFNDSECDYLAMEISGINISLYYELIKRIDNQKLKCVRLNAKEHHEMFAMLQRDKVLDKLGIPLQFIVRSGCLKLDGEFYNDFQITLIYSTAIANKVLNEGKGEVKLSEKGENAKQELLNDIQKVRDIIESIYVRLTQ